MHFGDEAECSRNVFDIVVKYVYRRGKDHYSCPALQVDRCRLNFLSMLIPLILLPLTPVTVAWKKGLVAAPLVVFCFA